jgi:polyhydroxyalkanoate synthase subunit PhaC
VGYCIGGTLLIIAAAAMAAESDDRLKSITLFAAEIDFKEAGELRLFIDDSQITFLEDIMWEKGYLDGIHMAGAFSMLRSNDLIWSRVIRDYLMGKRRPLNDLMAWDFDPTRLPYKMHSEYLRDLFLDNSIVQGNFKIWGKNVTLPEINIPIFAVSTLTDHVAPWRSVYKLHLFTDTEITFVLTSGGHNAGIVSEPGHRHRTFQILTRKKQEKRLTPELWQDLAPRYEGSWWPEWQAWLEKNSEDKVAPPELGNPQKGYMTICDAPGTYVFQK